MNIEVAGKLPADGARGILDATDTEVHFHMEVLMQQLNVRVSYHDMKMFVAIMESLPRQTGAAGTAESRVSTQPVNLQGRSGTGLGCGLIGWGGVVIGQGCIVPD